MYSVIQREKRNMIEKDQYQRNKFRTVLISLVLIEVFTDGFVANFVLKTIGNLSSQHINISHSTFVGDISGMYHL